MPKKANAGATHAEPTENITSPAAPAMPAPEAPKTLAQLEEAAKRELLAVNQAIDAGVDYTSTKEHLDTALKRWNEKLLSEAAGVLVAQPLAEMYRVYLPNPSFTGKSVKLEKETGHFALRDVGKYVPFTSLVTAASGRDLTTLPNWEKCLRALRYNLTAFACKDSGNASSNIALDTDLAGLRKAHGWTDCSSIQKLTQQLNDCVAAILPEELRPQTMYKADVKQLLHAVTPEKGAGHDTANIVKKLPYFTQKFFAVVNTRLQEKGYLYADEENSSGNGNNEPAPKNPTQPTKEELRKAAEAMGMQLVEKPEAAEG